MNKINNDWDIDIETEISFCVICCNIGAKRDYRVIVYHVNNIVASIKILKEISNYPKIFIKSNLYHYKLKIEIYINSILNKILR